MVSKKSIHGVIAASMITLSMVTSAYATISCPSTTDVKGAVSALNTVMRQSEKGYFVLTAQPAINASNLDWILVAQTSGNGFDAAYANGQNSVKSVIAAVSDEPMEQQGFYLCGYISSGGINVMTIAPQQQKITFNPALINLDVLKQKK